MKIETTISLDPELRQELACLVTANGYDSLAELVEDLLRRFVVKEKSPVYDFHELESINRNADRLNKEAEDVLGYQIEL